MLTRALISPAARLTNFLANEAPDPVRDGLAGRFQIPGARRTSGANLVRNGTRGA